MTNYPLVKQADIIRYPHAFSFPIAKTRSVSAIKKTENRSNLYLFGLPITILCLPFSVRRSEPVKKQLAVSRFRPPLLRYVRSVFAASSPDTRKIRVSGNKTVHAYAALCASAVFQTMPVSETVQYLLLKPSNEARFAVPSTPV